MRSVPLIRCLPKMSPSSSTSTDSHIATWRRSLTWTCHQFGYELLPPSTGKMFVWPPAFFLWTRFSAIFFDTVTHNCLIYQTLYYDFFEVYITKKWWLYHQMFKRSSDQFNSLDVSHVTNHSSFSLVNRLAADAYRYHDHKYVNIHSHQLFIFSEINNG